MPSISFDFCYTKCLPDKGDSKEIDSIIALLMVDSASGYIQAVPLRNKNQWNLMVHELLFFAGWMGHSEVTFRCDNEPKRTAINVRQSTRGWQWDRLLIKVHLLIIQNRLDL